MGTTWESVVRRAYGTSCLGTQISVSGRPVIGSAATVQLTGGAPGSFAAMSLGLDSTTSAFGPLLYGLGGIGAPAGVLLVAVQRRFRGDPG